MAVLNARASETAEEQRKIGRVERAAEALARALEDLHGGYWDVHIDYDVGLIVVSRDFGKRLSSNSA